MMRHLYSITLSEITQKMLSGIKQLACRLLAIAFFLFTISNYSFAQITISQNSNDTILSQMLVGSGVTISNVTKNCNTAASGTFSSTATNLGIQQGIVLATGKVTSIPQAASSFASTSLTGTGDAQLSTLTTGTIYDPCILEFDLVPQGDTLSFKYVFASEEYPEFVCSQFNDVFGFFISGPNPAGGNYTNKNMALIPNSTMPVCINSVNPGNSGTYNGTTWNSNGCMSLSNTAYYVNNLTPAINPNIVYDGMTTVLDAVATVVPCQKYHLKIAISDVGDRLYDSGVFLQAYSVSSTSYTTVITSKINDPAYTSAYEGCMGGTFTVSISSAQTTPVTIALNISGTATNGVDYNTIPSSVTIPAGQTSVTIPLTAIQDNITEPTETVTVSVLNPCTGAVLTGSTLTIMDDPACSLTVADSTLCLGQSTQLTATWGGSYSWSPTTGLSSSTISNPVATPTTTTTYTANIILGSCPYQLSKTIYVSNPAVSITSSPGDTVCIGAIVHYTASTADTVSPYKYLWSNGNTTNNINGSISGAYSVTGTDGYGCTAFAAKILVDINPSLNVVTTNVNCFGNNTGAITTTPAAGISPYTYLWSNGATSANLSSAVAGNYNVTATDAKGCTATATAAITQPVSALLPVATVTGNVSCFGGNNGAINLTVTGGTPAYIYNWAGGVTTQNRSNLSAGNYPVTVTDSKGCTASVSASVTQPVSVLTVSATSTNVSCYGTSTGLINLVVSGGTAPYAYNWNGGVTTQNRTNLAAGTYTATITDANGCSVSVSATVTQPAAALNVIATPNAVSCYGGNNGTIGLNVTGGTTPYFYTWNNGATIPNIANLIPGNYSVTVTDAKGCAFISTSTINQPLSPLTATPTVTNVSCFGSNNGAITLAIAGGTPTYSYVWNDGVTTQNRANLSLGTYHVTVTDTKGCSATTSATISQPIAALSAIATTTNVGCFGGNTGSINLTVSGGTTAYTYSWTGGITTQNRNNLAAGTYNATVTDANGCSVTVTSTITQPLAALSATATPNAVSCFGGNTGTIGLSVSGGTPAYTYLWTTGATIPNIANLVAGTYSVTVTDAKGCSATASSVITQPVSALSLSTATTNVSCFGSNNGAIDLTVTGGTPAYTYNWTGGVTTQDRTNLVGGNYQVTVTDTKGCSATTSATISQPVAALSATATATNVGCFGGATGAISLTVSGGTTAYTYSWTGGITTQNRTNLSIGTYNATITDANGCSVTVTSTITQPLAALSATATPNAVSCFGGNNGTIGLSVAGGTPAYTYLWTTGATIPNIANLVAGTYSVTVTDAKGCSATASSVITQPVSALSLSTTTTNVSCFGSNNGAIDLTVTGGTPSYTYNWIGGVTTQDRMNLAGGNYQVTVTDTKGCSATTSATISQPVAALSAAATATNVGCFGGNTGSISLSVSGGTTAYTYSWTGGITTQNRTNLIAGTYNATVTDANGCSVSVTSTITQPVAALSATATPNAVSCFGGNNGTIGLSVAGGTPAYTYLWTTGATIPNIANLVAGTYSVTVTDTKGCSATASSVITQPVSALSLSTTTTHVSCFGSNNGAIDLTVTGGTPSYTYNWTGGVITQDRTNLVGGNYQVTVTDAKGCSATTSAVISQPVAALSATATATNVGCFGGNTGSISLSVSGGTTAYTYSWTGGITTQNRNNLSAGTYNATVTDANGCSVTVTSTITQSLAALSATATPNAVSCFGGNNGTIGLSVAGGTPAYTYLWTTGATIPNIANLVAGTYSVTVTDAKGCSTTASSVITQPVSALSLSTTTTHVSCFGSNNGAIDLTVTGGTPSYTYNWTGGVITQDRTNLVGGNYQVTVTDTKGCSATTSATISQPVAALSATATATNVGCFGGNTGSISLTVSGGTTAYTYSWTGGITTQNRNNLAAGTYNATVTDANGCSVTVTSTITQPGAALNVTVAGISPVLCYNGSTGGIQLNVGGGSSPYNFSWSNGETSQAMSNAGAGNYAVSVTDAHACSATASATITQPSAALSVTLTPAPVHCYGGNSGTIVSNTTGGTAPYTYNWNDGSQLQNRSNISGGNYQLSVTDANGCLATGSVVVAQPISSISASLSANNVSCYGGSNGSLLLSAQGGTTPYTYLWNDGASSGNRSSLTAGNYSITVTDANGCIIIASASVVQPISPLTANTNPASVQCYGGNNGSIALQATGGTSPYSYNWGGGVTTANRNNLSAGVYHATVTDANGCSTTIIDTIAQPASAISGSLVSNSIVCYGEANGIISVHVTGGVLPYNYNWSDGQNISDRDSLIPGSYTLTITDANACSATLTAQITQPAQPLKALAAVTNVSCHAGSNGAIALSVSGGTPPYLYKWDGGSVSQNRNQLNAGDYQVTVTDANGCQLVELNSVTEPGSLSVTLNATPVSCFNGRNGSITLTANGGTSGYAYNWGNGITTQNRTQLYAGTYTVSLTDANACTVASSAVVGQPSAALVVSATVGNVNCNGGNNGSIQLSANGGTAPYSFAWADGDTSQNRTGLTAGNYYIQVSDNQGCGASTSPTITQPANALSATVATGNVSCFNGNNGTVSLTVTGGTTPYQYSWNSGQTSQNLSNLVAGTYRVSINDAHGCSAQASAIVTQPTSGLNAALNANNINCFGGNNGSINLTISGGTSPYSYVWSDGSTTQNIQNIVAGNYHVTITDSKACNTIANASVTQPASAVSATITPTGVSCHGGSNGALNVHASGGTAPYNYNWGGGIISQNRSGLSAGNYSVTVTDLNACPVVVSATVTQPTAAIAISATVSAVSCHGGNNGVISLSVSGGTTPYSYNWGSGITTQNRSGLAAGNYMVTVTDLSGCSALAHDTVGQPLNALTAIPSVTSQVSCYNGSNGSIQLSVTGGTSPYTFNWNGGVTTENRNNIAAGNYSVTVTDNHGCTAISHATITQPDSALAIVTSVVNVKCYGGANGVVNINPTGGTAPYHYNWTGGVTTQNRSGLTAGNYSVTVIDSKGCVASATAPVTQAGSAISATGVVTEVSCYGGQNGAIKLNVTGGISPYTFAWNGGTATQNRNNIAAGNYSVTVTDANGCSTKTNLNVTSPDSISLQLSVSGPTCFGSKNGKLQVTATGGTPGYWYMWNTGAGTSLMLDADAGTYAVTVTDFGGCSASRTGIIVAQPTQINVATVVVRGSCSGDDNGQLNTTVSGGTSPYQYMWSNNGSGPAINHLAPGNYVVTVTDANQCTQIASGIINDLPAVAGSGNASPLPCINAKGEIQFYVTSGTGPYTFKWSNGDTTENLYNAHPGTYTITVKDANGCSFDTAFTIDNLNNFSVQASGGGTIKLGENTEVHATSTGSSQTTYDWTPGNSLSCVICPNAIAQPVETTTYTVVGTDTNGCTANDTVSVIVIDDYSIFTPNAFTPNGDGNNDYFQIFGNLGGIHSIEIKIFNRWGEKVFESEDPEFKWDGTYKDVLQMPGVFVYEMKVVFLDGRSDELKKGSITLIR